MDAASEGKTGAAAVMPANGIRRRIYETLEAGSTSIAGRMIAFFITALILLNVAAIVLETEKALYERYLPLFQSFEIFSVIVFTVEYALRLWACPVDERFARPVLGRIRFMLTPFAIIDLLAILPFYIPMVFPVNLLALRALRLVRLVRLFKMGRYSVAVRTLINVFVAKRHELAIAAFAVGALLVIASSGMYWVEHEAQPKTFSSIPAAMWWGVATLSTVGYGDIYPVTPLGRFLGGVIALMGVGIFGLPAGILGSGFVDEMNRKKQLAKKCPHCGKEIDGQ